MGLHALQQAKKALQQIFRAFVNTVYWHHGKPRVARHASLRLGGRLRKLGLLLKYDNPCVFFVQRHVPPPHGLLIVPERAHLPCTVLFLSLSRILKPVENNNQLRRRRKYYSDRQNDSIVRGAMRDPVPAAAGVQHYYHKITHDCTTVSSTQQPVHVSARRHHCLLTRIAVGSFCLNLGTDNHPESQD